MASAVDLLTTENVVFRKYLFYSSILVVKMMAMSVLTSWERLKKKAFANPEDAVSLKVKPKTDDSVERIRRAHLNDLENIIIFFVASFGYILTDPSAFFAILLFRIFTAARLLHTLVYAVVVIPQPARALSWATGFLITGYMALCTFWHFC